MERSPMPALRYIVGVGQVAGPGGIASIALSHIHLMVTTACTLSQFVEIGVGWRYGGLINVMPVLCGRRSGHDQRGCCRDHEGDCAFDYWARLAFQHGISLSD